MRTFFTRFVSRLLPILPYLLLAGYAAYNQHRFRGYEDVKYDATIAVHFPELIEPHRQQTPGDSHYRGR